MTTKEINKVLQNPNTQVLVEWLGGMLKVSNKYIISDQFFHKTHTVNDRKVLVKLLLNFFSDIDKIDVQESGVVITIK